MSLNVYILVLFVFFFVSVIFFFLKFPFSNDIPKIRLIGTILIGMKQNCRIIIHWAAIIRNHETGTKNVILPEMKGNKTQLIEIGSDFVPVKKKIFQSKWNNNFRLRRM